MKPTTEGQRLKALREALGATQDLIAELAGVKRVTIVRVEKDQTKWRSTDTREGIMRAYSMTYEQLKDYISGVMSLRDAMDLAAKNVEAALNVGAEDKKRDQLLNDVIRRASAHGEILPGTRDALAVVCAESGPHVPIGKLVQQAISINEGIKSLVAASLRNLKSDVRVPK